MPRTASDPDRLSQTTLRRRAAEEELRGIDFATFSSADLAVLRSQSPGPAGAERGARRREMASRFTDLDPALLLLLTSWLWSAETSNLRAASRECLALFLRNVPAPTREVFYRESVVEPPGFRLDRPEEGAEEGPHVNSLSPARCWPIPLSRVRSALLVGQSQGFANALQSVRTLAFACAVVARDGFALHVAEERFERDGALVMAAVLTGELVFNLSAADARLKDNRHVVFAVVKENGTMLRFADDSLKCDKDVVLAAVKLNYSALHYADASMKSDKDVVLAAVKQDGSALQHADASLKRDKDVVLAAIKQSFWAREHADASLKSDKDVVLAAVTKYGRALE